eukprot:3455663-Amphidinium_carterae.1
MNKCVKGTNTFSPNQNYYVTVFIFFGFIFRKRACKGSGTVLAFGKDRFALRYANRYSSLEREQTDDDEVWYSASSDVENGPKQVATCSRGGVFGVPEQLSVTPSDQVLPGQSVPEDVVRDDTSAALVQVGTFSAGEVLGVAQRRSG